MKIYIKRNGSKPPEDKYFYIVARNGIFIHKDNPVMETVLPVDGISTLEPQTEVVNIKFPTLSARKVLQTMSFFLKCYKKYGGESIVLLHYRPGGGYLIHAPEQRVANGILDYSPQDHFDGYLLVGSIHCHGSLMACHSTGHEHSDHSDEADFDGMHITVGNINRRVISISASVTVNGRRLHINPLEHMEGIEEFMKDYPGNGNHGSGMYTYVYPDPYFFTLSLPEGKRLRDVRFPKKWLRNVSKYPWKERCKVYPQYLTGGMPWNQ